MTDDLVTGARDNASPRPIGVDGLAVGLSVVIVTWNSRQVLVGCLASLAEHPPSCTWEVIVVDNGSADGCGSVAAEMLAGVRVIANADNRGLPAANNQGMLAAKGDVFLICNPDIVFGSGSIDAMLATLRRHPRAAMVVPRLTYEDGTLQTSVGSIPTLRDAVLGRQLLRRFGKGESSHWWDDWAHDTEREIGRGFECAYLVRREAVEQVGLQDEGFILDWEGQDWTARMHDAGWEVWFCPDASVVHLGGASIRQIPFRSVVRSHRGMYRFYAKRHPAARPLLAVLFSARAAAKLAAVAVGARMYERSYRAES